MGRWWPDVRAMADGYMPISRVSGVMAKRCGAVRQGEGLELEHVSAYLATAHQHAAWRWAATELCIDASA